MLRSILAATLSCSISFLAFAQDGPRQGRITRVDAEKGTIRITAGAKDHEFTVTERSRLMDGSGSVMEKGLRDERLKKGTPVMFRGIERDGRMVLDRLRLVAEFDDRPPGAPSEPAQRMRTSPDTSKFKPITELGDGQYHGFNGGLYPFGKNERPAEHELAGVALAKSIRPLDGAGKPSDDGRIVLLSIGMSNTTQEFSTFKRIADRDTGRNPKLVIVDGAQGGMTAAVIRKTDDGGRGTQFWNMVDERLKNERVTREQVQAAWVKEADAGPTQPFPQHAKVLQAELAEIARVLHERFPNLKLVYLSSRTYGGYATTRLNPEPFAYETGFAVKWLIEQQLGGDPDLNFDPAKGAVKAPWLSWGPYLWANGTTPRADGFHYEESDFGNDGTHPSRAGQEKVAGLLLKFFKTDSTTRPWFTANSRDRSAHEPSDQDGVVPAQPAGDNDGGAPGDADVPPLFSLLDRNRDGKLSREELEDAATTLSALDRNDDGLIEREEIARAAGRRRGGRPGEIITPAAKGERHKDTLAADDEAPDFTLPSPDGKREWTLSSFRTKRPVVLVFTSFT